VNGQLAVSDVNQSFARTERYTGPTLTSKTLVAWVSLDSLSDSAGSALTIEKQTGGDPDAAVFDAIVYAEVEDRKWMAGSDHFNRTEDPPQQGTLETADPTELVKLAIVYEMDNSITIYRNDVLYSQYSKGELQSYPGNADTAVVFGLRHSDADPSRAFLTGRIEEAQLYDRALSAEELRDLTPVVGHPTCTLSLATSLTDGTLSLAFTLGTQEPATWNIWLTAQNEVVRLLSVPLGVLDPPVSVPFTIPFVPALGTVGVLTTLTTPDQGIICSAFATVETGSSSEGVAASTHELQDMLQHVVQ
jgi:hypothetical protein